MHITKNIATIYSIDQLLSFKIIIEFDVYSKDGEYIGVSEDILVDKHGKPTFLIIECVESHFSVKRYIAVPFASIRIDLDLEVIRIGLAKKKLNQLPSFCF